jgi:hypothetical protein
MKRVRRHHLAHWLVGILLYGGCDDGGEQLGARIERGTASGPEAEPRPAARSDRTLEPLSLAGATLDAPAGWAPLEPSTVARLTGTVTRLDPEALVQVEGRRLPHERAPLLSLMSTRLSASASRHQSPERAMLDAIDKLRVAGAARGAAVEADGDCSPMYCDMEASFSDEPALEMRNRIRFWWEGSSIVQLGCSCIAQGCAYIESCSLPVPAATAPARSAED